MLKNNLADEYSSELSIGLEDEAVLKESSKKSKPVEGIPTMTVRKGKGGGKDAVIEHASSSIEGMRTKLAGNQQAARILTDAPVAAPVTAKGEPQLEIVTLLHRKQPLRDELPHALRAYNDALDCVRRFMGFAGQGSVYTDSIEPVISAITSSLERNFDALICLPRVLQRGSYLHSHSVNVCILLAAFALRSGKPRQQVTAMALGGLFHDLGKALLPGSLLNSRKRLSETEQSLVKRHPVLGHRLMADSNDRIFRSELLSAALEHHERFDGSGYPRGISGEAISEIGHIAAIADAYDAISSRRPYKGALYPHRTLGVMYQKRKAFHPEFLQQFVQMVGIYPVGSIVELKDGYRGVVSASNPSNPLLPVVTLAMDSNGLSMPHLECDLSKEEVAGIARCLGPEESGVEPQYVLSTPMFS